MPQSEFRFLNTQGIFDHKLFTLRIYQQAVSFAERPAVHSHGQWYTYAALVQSSKTVSAFLLNIQNTTDLKEQRIAFLVTPGFGYVVTQWGIWQAGGIAVPLCPDHPPASLDYYLQAVGCTMLIYSQDLEELAHKLAVPGDASLHSVEEILSSALQRDLPEINTDRRAMILFTSGTTNKPKGVVTTHGIIESQIKTLVEAWQWSSDDRILNVLPLHHVHGIVNVMSCALWSGASCRFLPRFSAHDVWESIRKGELTLFMAVPTIYYKLITYWEDQASGRQSELSQAASRMRLMVSGSAALPVSTLVRWREITAHTLLERYGMTEIGMGLSNPYDGERRAGHVGLPLPGVDLRLVDEAGRVVNDQQGEIQVKGPTIFLEYWNNPGATSEAFTEGWFKTGDIAKLNNGSYRILGRNSVDIIKSGGYKISALEIEEVLRTHPAISECAVVGIPDPEWGELVGVALVASSEPISEAVLEKWMKERLPAYQVPRKRLWVGALPRNTLGKVTKKDVVRILQ